MSKEPWDWEETELLTLVGQSENYRLEFKSSQVLQKDNRQIANELTKEVSALANAEGGIIVIGIQEKSVGKTKVAEKVDNGVDEATMNRERLQQLVEGNLSPHLPGLRFKPIYLFGTSPSRYAFVIYVPQGSNAYQASDKIYYIRSEYEAKALHDTQIRLLMNRGKTTQATIQLNNKNTKIAADVYQRQKQGIPSRAEGTYPKTNAANIRKQMIDKFIADEMAKLKMEEFDEYTFSLYIKNTGELTICECYLEFEILFIEGLDQLPSQKHPRVLLHEGANRNSSSGKNSLTYSSEENNFAAKRQGKFEPENKIYPGLSRRLSKGVFVIQILAGKTLKEMEARLAWTLYYDNFPSNSGVIDLASEF